MNDKTLVFHAGPHKTGSTYLQYRLLRARGALAEQSWEYPDYGIKQYNHQHVYSWLLGNTAEAGEVTETSFRELISSHSRLILSSEDFIYLPQKTLLKLKSLLDGVSVQVVLYIRNPVDLWPSHWQELVRHGRYSTLLEYIGAHAGWTDALETGIMNPLVQARKFSSVFGPDAIRMFCYENLTDQRQDLFEHFWTKILGIDAPPPFEAPKSINASQSTDKTEMLRCLNEIYWDRYKSKPMTKILAAYQKQQKTFEALPEYEEFKRALQEHATMITLNSNQEIFRVRERMLLNNFGKRIENKAAETKLFDRDSFERKIPYAQRYWIDRVGLRPFVETVFERLNIV